MSDVAVAGKRYRSDHLLFRSVRLLLRYRVCVFPCLDCSDFDDWGIILDQVSFKSNLPSEEELVALLKVVFGVESHLVHLSVPTGESELAHRIHGLHHLFAPVLHHCPVGDVIDMRKRYIGRDKKIPLPSVVASLQIDHCWRGGFYSPVDIRDESVRKALSLPLPSSSHPPSLPSPNQTILNAFHTLTHHSLCLPMKVFQSLPFHHRSTLPSLLFPTTATGYVLGTPRATDSSCSSRRARDISFFSSYSSHVDRRSRQRQLSLRRNAEHLRDRGAKAPREHCL